MARTASGLVYRVGIKRKWWFGYKEYHVLHHVTSTYVDRPELKNSINIKPRLFLYLTDGSEICIPEIDTKGWKVYPEYKKVKKTLEAKAKKEPKEMAILTTQHQASEEDPKTLQ